jgi:hypothetical protein
MRRLRHVVGRSLASTPALGLSRKRVLGHAPCTECEPWLGTDMTSTAMHVHMHRANANANASANDRARTHAIPVRSCTRAHLPCAHVNVHTTRSLVFDPLCGCILRRHHMACVGVNKTLASAWTRTDVKYVTPPYSPCLHVICSSHPLHTSSLTALRSTFHHLPLSASLHITQPRRLTPLSCATHRPPLLLVGISAQCVCHRLAWHQRHHRGPPSHVTREALLPAPPPATKTVAAATAAAAQSARPRLMAVAVRTSARNPCLTFLCQPPRH